MTDAEIEALEAGSELDKMVADACGIRLDHNGLIVPQLTDCAEINFSTARHSFGPSSDWNDAMWAVEKVNWQRTHEGDRIEVSYQWNGTWNATIRRYYNDYTVPSEMQLGINHPSGPVAICRAILKAVKK